MELLWFVKDAITGQPLDEVSPEITIRRDLDGYLFDWLTDSFTVSAAPSAISTSYEHIEFSELPGLYKKDVDVSAWDDGTYTVISYIDEMVNTRYLNNIEELVIVGGAVYNDYILYGVLGDMKNSIDDVKDAIESMSTKIKETPSGSLLIQEYYNNQDADGNSLIYGVDFYITTDRPKILEFIPRKGTPMTWQEYLNSVS